MPPKEYIPRYTPPSKTYVPKTQGPTPMELDQVKPKTQDTRTCYYCKQVGHFANVCPEAPPCNICKKKGHRTANCRDRRQVRKVQPEDKEVIMKIKKTSSNAIVPKTQTSGAIGLDLHANEEVIMEKGQRKLVPTGIAMEVPKGHCPRIAPRSGLSLKGIDIGAGVIDPDYRGEIKALVINNGNTDYKISKQDRIAQVVVEKAVVPEVKEVKELGKTERDGKGFGSTNNVQLMNNINKNHSNRNLFSVFLKKGLKMLTIEGDIGGNKINALVDSGAGDNYVSLEVAQHLKKYQRARKEVTVSLADGKEYKITKKLANVPISFKGWKTHLSFDILPLQGHQVILGRSWLYQNNPSIDWKNNQMSIQENGKNIVIKDKDF